MYVITNMTDKPLTIDGVVLDPKEQLGNISVLSADMKAAQIEEKLRVETSDETLEERKSDTEAFKPFKGPL